MAEQPVRKAGPGPAGRQNSHLDPDCFFIFSNLQYSEARTHRTHPN
ncbi:hypothetical protein ANCCAN_14213 [Ancylostoma caninum]|uniref:Uncharacterized protein n=1 Tax=Ancylostoma caninum TaxID=29170 RepID=A0A368GAR8_ANCCA|nr:hypothetical protein ANCCAN_14213 [Ancylostoma caninum]